MKQAERLQINFTGKCKEFEHFSSFNDEVVSLLRQSAPARTLIVVDYGYGLKTPHLVQDHLNLTGNNPLTGPNHPCGERFPVISNVYLRDNSLDLPYAIAAGLKAGIIPDADDLELTHSLGADCYSYNLIPTVLVAAHTGWKVLAIVIPEGYNQINELKI